MGSLTEVLEQFKEIDSENEKQDELTLFFDLMKKLNKRKMN